jgi:Tfp pilus assembly protein PilO
VRPSAFTTVDACGAAALALLTLAVYLGGVAPLKAAAQQAQVQRALLAERREELDAAEKQCRELSDGLTRVDAELNRRATRLERGTQINVRVQHITELAEAAGLNVTSMTPGQEVPGKRFGRVPIKLTGTGDYPSFGAFVAALHAQYRDIQVVGFKLSGRPASPDSGLTFESDLTWYTAPESAARAAGDGGAGSNGAQRRPPAEVP